MSEEKRTTLTGQVPDGRKFDDLKENGQQEAYVILTEEERAKGFVRPVRTSYVHVGPPGPKYPLRDLTKEEKERWAVTEYIKYEEYPAEETILGRFWTQEQLDQVEKGCGAATNMSRALAETYARDPGFYGATFCTGCGKHLPVGENGEFVWEGTDERVGT